MILVNHMTKNKKENRKYIFVVGGVISGVGKGITSSSLGLILKNRGLSVTAIKIDPYINVDAGTMNPTEHGEVFVLSDGDETDQDMGNYERFLDIKLTKVNYMTTGRVYQSVIEAERNLEYKGKCVEVVPHIPIEVIGRIKKAGENAKADVVIIEIGGTIGEYQMFCNVTPERIISAPDVDSIYDIPLNFEKENLSSKMCEILNIQNKKPDNKLWSKWKTFAKHAHNGKETVKIAVIGKYFETGDFVLSDSYLSVIEAIKYSSYAQNRKPIISWLNAVDFEKDKSKLNDLKKYDGIIVPGGFGSRGVEGKLNVVKYARENKIPYFGLCYGMQMVVIEYARNVLGLTDANTTEVNPKTKSPVVDIMESQKENLINHRYGGNMRLGEYKAVLADKSIAREAYKAKEVIERHRHRYEVNNTYINNLEKAGLVFSGKSPDGLLMEIAELPKVVHPFFLGAQFHPEFLAHPLAPHPLFTAFVKACIKK
ncbi:MAG: CTP synthase [Candidatus Nomurabacteria bacterium]|nr:CTP synthase [Candidatus Nomurabacteria bacterium]